MNVVFFGKLKCNKVSEKHILGPKKVPSGYLAYILQETFMSQTDSRLLFEKGDAVDVSCEG